MRYAKVAVSIQEDLLKQVDRLVKGHKFASRSQAIQSAIRNELRGLENADFAAACAKLNPEFEKAMAEEGLSTDLETWPEY